MLYNIGIGLAIFSAFGLLILLMELIMKSEKDRRETKKKRQKISLAALESEIQMLESLKNSISQRGMKVPQQLDLLTKKWQLEKKLVELEMQGVALKSLYEEIHRQIEQIEAQIEIVERGDVGKLIIEQQAEIKKCLEEIAQGRAIALGELERDLEKQFTPDEVQNILLKSETAVKEVLAMTATTLDKQQV